MFSPKDPEEIITVTFDFSNVVADTPTAAAVTAAVASGPDDAAVAAMVSGSPSISGALVRQRIINGKAGTTYSIRCRIDTPDGSRYVLSDLLPVMSL